MFLTAESSLQPLSYSFIQDKNSGAGKVSPSEKSAVIEGATGSAPSPTESCITQLARVSWVLWVLLSEKRTGGSQILGCFECLRFGCHSGKASTLGPLGDRATSEAEGPVWPGFCES